MTTRSYYVLALGVVLTTRLRRRSTRCASADQTGPGREFPLPASGRRVSATTGAAFSRV